MEADAESSSDLLSSVIVPAAVFHANNRKIRVF